VKVFMEMIGILVFEYSVLVLGKQSGSMIFTAGDKSPISYNVGGVKYF